MEEDGEHSGSQITFSWLKELSDWGSAFFLPHRPAGSHLPTGRNIWRRLPFMLCPGQRTVVAVGCLPLWYTHLYSLHVLSMNSNRWPLTECRSLCSILFCRLFLLINYLYSTKNRINQYHWFKWGKGEVTWREDPNPSISPKSRSEKRNCILKRSKLIQSPQRISW